MCGIAGILSAHAREDIDHVHIVQDMMDRLKHRGPDGEGRISHGHAILGHRRLAIIDVDHGQQPFLSPDERYGLTYNGEIYNYKELRDTLKQDKSAVFETDSDTEVLLQMLIHYGEDALPKLTGMYAFCFHDKETGNVILARDEMGVKPLYYSITKDGELVFASEIKALFSHPSITARVSNPGLRQYITFQFCLDEQTLFEGVKILKPAHKILLNTNQPLNEIKQLPHWLCSYDIDESLDEDSYHEKLKSMIEESVRLQLRSDVPLGTYLSGGIDSSLITAIAAQKQNDMVKAFHGRFAEGPAYDESEHAHAVCEKTGAEYIEVVPNAQQFVDVLPALIYHMDEPAAGPGLFPQFCVSQKASQHVKVILGGQGGDEIFGGYARYVVGYLEQALKGAITGSNDEGKHLVTLASIVPNLKVLEKYTPMMKNFWADGLFGEMDARYFRLINRAPGAKKLLAGDIMNDRAQHDVFETFQSIFNIDSTSSYINKMTHFDMKTLLPALLQVEDRVSMSVSLESRVPLIDRDIVDTVMTIPPPMKFSGGKTKHLLKNIAEHYLPDSVVHREDKMGFPVPLREWMEGGVVRDFIADIMLSQASRERGLFHMPEIEKLIVHEGQFGRQLWGALCLELWHQIFIDGTLKPSALS